MLIGNIFSLLLVALKRISISSGNKIHLPNSTAENNSNAEELIIEDYEFPTTVIDISEKKTMINVSMLQDILQNFVTSTLDIQGVALVSPDGLSLASVLPTQMHEERTAAMSASILSLGERIGNELSRGGVERIVVEGEKGYGILVGCGSEAVLLVLASSTAKQGLIFLEIKRISTKITELLA
ncbi:MAG: roadblock/LC7 domain-containing protein [Cyanobacteria bacterium P01_A01_bin.68]